MLPNRHKPSEVLNDELMEHYKEKHALALASSFVKGAFQDCKTSPGPRKNPKDLGAILNSAHAGR